MKTTKKNKIRNQKFVHPLQNVSLPNFEIKNNTSSNIKIRSFQIGKPTFFKQKTMVKPPFSSQICILMKTIYINHFLALLMIILAIGIQIAYPHSFYLNPPCICSDKVSERLYTLSKEIFSLWIISLASLYLSVFHLKELNENKVLKLLFFLIKCAIVGGFYLLESPSTNTIELVKEIFYLWIFTQNIFYIIYLVLIKFQFKVFFSKYLKGTALGYFIVLNNFIFSYLIGMIKKSLHSQLEDNFANFTARLCFIAYLLLHRLIGIKLLWIYYRAFQTEGHNQSRIEIAVSLWARNIFTQIYTVNVMAIIRAETLDWFSFFLYVDYFSFLIQGYTQIDLKRIMIFKLLKFFFGYHVKKREISTEKEYFKQILAGGLMDVQIACFFQLSILISWNRWSVLRSLPIYLQDCSLQISSKFKINLWSIGVLFAINVLTMTVLLIYMLKNKVILLVYKISQAKLLMLLDIFFIHNYLQWLLQIFSFIAFDDHS